MPNKYVNCLLVINTCNFYPDNIKYTHRPNANKLSLKIENEFDFEYMQEQLKYALSELSPVHIVILQNRECKYNSSLYDLLIEYNQLYKLNYIINIISR